MTDFFLVRFFRRWTRLERAVDEHNKAAVGLQAAVGQLNESLSQIGRNLDQAAGTRAANGHDKRVRQRRVRIVPVETDQRSGFDRRRASSA